MVAAAEVPGLVKSTVPSGAAVFAFAKELTSRVPAAGGVVAAGDCPHVIPTDIRTKTATATRVSGFIRYIPYPPYPFVSRQGTTENTPRRPCLARGHFCFCCSVIVMGLPVIHPDFDGTTNR